jgi:NAD-dependent dihydropyrimidine dehydrogenase PreA subunit
MVKQTAYFMAARAYPRSLGMADVAGGRTTPTAIHPVTCSTQGRCLRACSNGEPERSRGGSVTCSAYA